MKTSYETLTKTEKMDAFIRNENEITPSLIYSIVNEVFDINLVEISQKYEEYNQLHNGSSASTLTKIQQLNKKIEEHNTYKNGAFIRILINDVFGVNLDGISSLENSGISVYSKGQWISQYPNDLFILRTGLGDVDVTISTTPYFYEYSQTKNIPESMQRSLGALGYTYDQEKDVLSYKNPANEAVPDSFKGQTMGAIMETIKTEYQNL